MCVVYVILWESHKSVSLHAQTDFLRPRFVCHSLLLWDSYILMMLGNVICEICISLRAFPPWQWCMSTTVKFSPMWRVFGSNPFSSIPCMHSCLFLFTYIHVCISICCYKYQSNILVQVNYWYVLHSFIDWRIAIRVFTPEVLGSYMKCLAGLWCARVCEIYKHYRPPLLCIFMIWTAQYHEHISHALQQGGRTTICKLYTRETASSMTQYRYNLG